MKKNYAVASAKKGMVFLMIGIAMLSVLLFVGTIRSHAAGSSGYNITVKANEKTLSGYNALYTRHLNLTTDKTVIISMYDIHNHLLWRGEVAPTPTMCVSYYVGSDVKYVTLKSKKGTAHVWYSFTR